MNTKDFQKIVSKLTFTHFYDELINGFKLKDMQEKKWILILDEYSEV